MERKHAQSILSSIMNIIKRNWIPLIKSIQETHDQATFLVRVHESMNGGIKVIKDLDPNKGL